LHRLEGRKGQPYRLIEREALEGKEQKNIERTSLYIYLTSYNYNNPLDILGHYEKRGGLKGFSEG